MESGPAKARAACTTAAGCFSFTPDLVLDSGSCAGIESGVFIGEIMICKDCYEYDIGGGGFPSSSIPEMRLPSAFSIMPPSAMDLLFREAGEAGSSAGFQVRAGNQACGELLIQSLEMRESLFSLFQATGANWETAGVFVAALKNCLPPVSIRIVTDLGNEQALDDFRSNVKKKAKELYRFIRILTEYGWFDQLLEHWRKLDSAVIDGLAQHVLP
jgi:nucleoside phosphorylase